MNIEFELGLNLGRHKHELGLIQVVRIGITDRFQSFKFNASESITEYYKRQLIRWTSATYIHLPPVYTVLNRFICILRSVNCIPQETRISTGHWLRNIKTVILPLTAHKRSSSSFFFVFFFNSEPNAKFRRKTNKNRNCGTCCYHFCAMMENPSIKPWQFDDLQHFHLISTKRLRISTLCRPFLFKEYRQMKVELERLPTISVWRKSRHVFSRYLTTIIYFQLAYCTSWNGLRNEIRNLHHSRPSSITNKKIPKVDWPF